ncbi:MAG: hypothetical protein FWE56_02440 [Candidatus Bathyarchaeota archaeon]|nr:hypothetical protein [Candidatus Termiticorpusculum sp.]MCL2868184.1 hypothetical protein [Candidatus Termiticorpusculum sp.]
MAAYPIKFEELSEYNQQFFLTENALNKVSAILNMEYRSAQKSATMMRIIGGHY